MESPISYPEINNKSNDNCSFMINENNIKTDIPSNKFSYKLTVIEKKNTNGDDDTDTDTDTDNVSGVNNYITSIDDYEQYYSPVISQDPVFIGTYSNDEISKCELLNIDEHDEQDDTNSLSYLITEKTRYVGELNIIDQILIDSEKSTIHGLRTMLFINDYVLDGINILQESQNPVIHNRLNADNILMDKHSRVPVIVNFNDSIFLKNIFNNSELFKYITITDTPADISNKYKLSNCSTSLELHLLSYVVHNVINVSLAKSVQSRDPDSQIGKTGISELMNVCIKFLRENLYMFSKLTYPTNSKMDINDKDYEEYNIFIVNLTMGEKVDKVNDINLNDVNLHDLYEFYKLVYDFINSFIEKSWGKLIFALISTWRKWDVYSLYISLFIAAFKSFIKIGNKTAIVKWMSGYFGMLRYVLFSMPREVDTKKQYDETYVNKLKNRLSKMTIIKRSELELLN